MSLLDDARRLGPEITELRHRLHEEPEVGLELPKTQAKVLAALEGLPLEITLGQECSSITAVLRGGDAAGAHRPTVLLRGDMDALPLQEKTGAPFSSQLDGVMHACGHDLHTAMLVGAAKLLCERRSTLAGDVVFMFQPGEEGFDGASVMIKEGVLDAAGRRVDAAYGIHVLSALYKNGAFATRPGPLMSASDGLFVNVRGAGGHGSAPHTAKDPVTVIAEMITSLQVMITRQFNMFDPVVLTVGRLRAGTKRNIIPDNAEFDATVRTFSTEAREKMRAAVPRLLEGIAAAHGLSVDVNYEAEYPLTINDDVETAQVETAVSELFGADRNVRMQQPLSGSEDFSRVLEEVPGAFVFLGAAMPGEDPAGAAFNHSPNAAFSDNILADGMTLYAELAVRRINRADG